MKYLIKYFPFKILLVIVLVTVFNNKITTSNLQENDSLVLYPLLFKKLADNDLEAIDVIDINEKEEEEEEKKLSKDFSANLQDKNVLTKKSISYKQYFNTYLFSSKKKRFYILYNQLKTHL